MTSEERMESLAKAIESNPNDMWFGPTLQALSVEALRDVLARLGAAEADTRRLDALATCYGDVDRGESPDTWIATTADGVWSDDLPTIRAAIDMAMGGKGDSPHDIG